MKMNENLSNICSKPCLANIEIQGKAQDKLYLYSKKHSILSITVPVFLGSYTVHNWSYSTKFQELTDTAYAIMLQFSRDFGGMYSSKGHYADKCYGFSEERVICRWKCSLWKLAWKQFILYFSCFVTISLLYRWRDKSDPDPACENVCNLSRSSPN